MTIAMHLGETTDREVGQLEEELLEWLMEKAIQGHSPETIDAAVRSIGTVTATTGDANGFVKRLHARSREVQNRRIQVLAS